MKKILFTILALTLVSLMAACTAPQREVLATRVGTALDKLIGEYQVKEQTAKDAISAAENDVQTLQRAEAENRVEADILTKKLVSLRQNRETARTEMLRLADALDQGKPLTLSDGRTISVADLKAQAKQIMDQYDVLGQTITYYESALERYNKAADDAHSRWTNGQGAVAVMKSKLEALDAAIAELKVLNQQPGAAPADTIQQSEATIDDLLGQMDKAVKVDELMKQYQAPGQFSDTAFTSSLQSTADVAKQLRQVVGAESTPVPTPTP